MLLIEARALGCGTGHPADKHTVQEEAVAAAAGQMEAAATAAAAAAQDDVGELRLGL